MWDVGRQETPFYLVVCIVCFVFCIFLCFVLNSICKMSGDRRQETPGSSSLFFVFFKLYLVFCVLYLSKILFARCQETGDTWLVSFAPWNNLTALLTCTCPAARAREPQFHHKLVFLACFFCKFCSTPYKCDFAPASPRDNFTIK